MKLLVQVIVFSFIQSLSFSAMLTRYANTACSTSGNGTTKTCGGANGAYTGLIAAVVAEATDLDDANNSMTIVCIGTKPETGEWATVDGFSTSAGDSLTIRTDSAEQWSRHGGTYTFSAYRLERTDGGLEILDDNVAVDGLQVLYTRDSNNYPTVVSIAGTNVTVKNSILKGVLDGGNDSRGFHCETAGKTSYSINNIIYFLLGGGYPRGIACDNGTIYAYNNTVASGTLYGLSRTAGTLVAKNNIVQYCSNNDYNGTFGTGSDYNISSDASDTNVGTHDSVNLSTCAFVNHQKQDFHLAVGDTIATGKATSLSADANYPFSYDIDAGLRGAVWDTGADQITADAPPAVQTNSFHSSPWRGRKGRILFMGR